MITLAITNQKGGVGKTTTTFHLARALQRRGLQTLVVDLDPQSNISVALSAQPLEDGQAGLAHALSQHSDLTIPDVVVSTVWDRVHLVPAGGDALAGVRNELVIAGPGREARLGEQLALVREDFDVCLIDCAPSLDLLTSNALAVADGVVIVTQSKLMSTTGLASLLETISAARRYLNPALTVAGVLVNLHEAGTIAGAHWLGVVEAACATQNLPLLTPPIPRRVVISDAAEARCGLDEYPGAPTALIDLYDTHLDAILSTMGGTDQ